jgi:hypothetical protein
MMTTETRDPVRVDPVRASDAERELAATALRDHAAAGRLTVEELGQRLQAAFAARTRKDLHELFGDLPDEPRPAARSRAARSKQRAHEAHVRAYLVFCAAMVVLWAVTGLGYFWPVWPIMGWGIGVASHTAVYRSRRSRGRAASAGSDGRGLAQVG